MLYPKAPAVRNRCRVGHNLGVGCIAPARRCAFEILLAVDRGGWASERLRDSPLEPRDAGLASEIVFGTLRRRAQLDWILEQQSGRPTARMDAAVRAALRMGAYQALHLDRVPRHAIVNDAVELVKRAGLRGAAGFVNAVLRRLRPQEDWPNPAVALSLPAWLLARWERQYGTQAGAIGRAALQEPARYLRIPGAVPAGLAVEPTEVAGCYRLLHGSDHGLRQQDISSQAVVPLLQLQPGQTFLDLCAAPGNKTAQALETPLRAVACDVHCSRLRQMRSLPCALVTLDATQPLPFRRKFDRILLDAPCTGTGTLARNPEIRWRLQPEKIVALHGLQVSLLRRALDYLAPGGRLVYSTCSLEREENEGVLEEVLGAVPPQCMRRIPGLDAGDGFFAAVIDAPAL